MSSSPSTKSSLSGSQQRLMNSFTSQLLGIKEMGDGTVRKSGPNLLQQGATPYRGQISVDPNEVSPERTASYLSDALLTPALRNFDQYIKPRIAESFAGGAINSRYGNQVAQSLGDIQGQFMGQLGQAQLSNMQLHTQLMQNQLSGKYQEFLRTSPENNPFLQMALAATGQNQLYGYQKPGIFDYLMGGAQAVGGLAKGAASLIAAGV